MDEETGISNSADAYEMHRKMMLYVGVWPKTTANFSYRLKEAAIYATAIFFLATLLMEVVHSINDYRKLAEILYMACTIASYLSKLAAFKINTPHFFELMKRVNDPFLKNYPSKFDFHMKDSMKRTQQVSVIFRNLCFVTCVLFMLYPLLGEKSLPLNFPYDEGFAWYFMYVFQIHGLVTTSWNDSCLDTITATFMGIAGAHLDILREIIMHMEEFIFTENLEEIGDAKNGEALEYLKRCVVYHNKVIRLIESVESVFSAGLLAHFSCSLVVICNTAFYLMRTSPDSVEFATLCLYFTAMMFELGMYCWFGNEIIIKSTKVRDACYLLKWYKFNPQVRGVLFLIMERSKRPSCVTAYRFTIVSLSAFSAIMQRSYSFYTVLRRVNDA